MNIRNEVLKEGKAYHIFNRTNAKVSAFKEAEDYLRFIALLKKYILPIAHIYSWSLLNNHYHLVLEIKDDIVYRWTKKTLPDKESNIWETDKLSQLNKNSLRPKAANHIGHLINSYAKFFNAKYNRTGGLFERPYKRIEIKNDWHLKNEIIYVSTNALKHRFVSNIYDWSWSSVEELLSLENHLCNSEYVVLLFSGVDNLRYMMETRIVDEDRRID